MNITKKREPFDYAALCRSLEEISARYKEAKIYDIGKSVTGRKLYVIEIGKGSNKVFYNGAHHGMEWLTSALLVKFAKEYLACIKKGRFIFSVNSEYLFKNVTLYLLPIVNPDGVEISIHGARIYTADYPRLFAQNNYNSDFTHWQANFNGVDLNHNYDALWERSKEEEVRHNILGPGPTRYAGKYPFSEPETAAMRDFTLREKFKLVMAFHSQGQEIYYSFNDREPIYSLGLAKAMTAGTPYTAAVPEGISSYGGYKDWFIERFSRPGFTVEIGKGENPLPMTELDKVYDETLSLLIGGMKAASII